MTVARKNSTWPGEASVPARYAAAVTPNDSIDLSDPTRGLYVGGAGDVTVIMAGDNAAGVTNNPQTFSSVPAGTTLPICVTRVKSTGTTATLIQALW